VDRKQASKIACLVLVSTALVFLFGLSVSVPVEAAVKLTAAEGSHLRFIREEEKLARDIYNVLGVKWELRIFAKIAESEQRHTDAVRLVIEKYGITDPAKATLPAVFADKKLQELYAALLVKGESSSLEALKVGALTEEKDIFDINEAVKETVKADILELYSYLKDGSSTHLRGFMAQIRAAGGDYAPQFISTAEFDKAMKAPQ